MKPALGCVALLLGACGEPADRPETINVCEGGGCENSGTGAQGYDSSSSSSSSTSTSGGSTAGNGVTVSGDVLVFVNDEFSLVETWSETALVQAPGADGPIVEGEFDGDLYRVDNVAQRAEAWFLTEPGDAALISPMPVLQPVDTRSTDDFDLFMVNRDVVEEIYAALTIQTNITPGRAQVVLQLVDAEGDPLPGVSIQSAEGDFIAYYSGTSWSDQDVLTDDSGLVMIGNVVASAYPGRGIQVVVSGAEDQEIAAEVAADAVTYRVVVVE